MHRVAPIAQLVERFTSIFWNEEVLRSNRSGGSLLLLSIAV